MHVDFSCVESSKKADSVKYNSDASSENVFYSIGKQETVKYNNMLFFLRRFRKIKIVAIFESSHSKTRKQVICNCK